MIEPMSHYTFLVFHKDYENFLSELADLGVAHVVTKSQGDIMTDALRKQLDDLTDLRSDITFLTSFKPTKKEKEGLSLTHVASTLEQGMKLWTRIQAIRTERESLIRKQQLMEKEIELMEPWGDFSFKRLQQLNDAGYILHFFNCVDRFFNPQWEEDFDLIKINDHGPQVYFVILTHGTDVPEIGIEPSRISELSLSEAQSKVNEAQAAQQALDKELEGYALNDLDSLALLEQKMTNAVDYSTVELSGDKQADDRLLILETWVPNVSTPAVDAYIEEAAIYSQKEKATIEEKDEVPIKLKNNYFTKLFEPITEMFALPNYSELDPTPYFAPFYFLFFGLCIGDAGYGLLLFLVSLFVRPKLDKTKRSYATLTLWLGGSTIFVGLVTGVFFGINLSDVDWGWIQPIQHYFINQKNFEPMLGTYDPMMIFALLIGLTQIFFGMGINVCKITKQHGFKYALAPLGWIVGLLSLAAVVILGVIGVAIPVLTYLLYTLIGVSALLAFFYNTPGKNPLINFSTGLWDTYNMASGLLGDTLSYIRLFALGLAGAVLGGVFNDLAFDLTSSLPLVAQIIAAGLILLIGHSINIGLCLIAAFVHPLRLTFVEFYKNAGFEGGGIVYKPFSKS